jgi:isocitrate dehydrogenase
VGTNEFAEAVIANLGKLPTNLAPVKYERDYQLNLPKYARKKPMDKQLEGVDIFVHWSGEDANELAQLISPLETERASLTMITNRGIKVWPNGFKETFCTDHWRCRFKGKSSKSLSKEDIIQLLQNAIHHNVDVIKTENLYLFDGVAAYSLGQGQ